MRVVKLAFDPEKDVINRQKQGAPLALAELLFQGRRLTVADDRFDYGETRKIAFGFIRSRLFDCVHVDRGAERRVISLRKANSRR